MDVRGPDLQGQGGESGAGADIEDAWSAVVSCQLPVASGRVQLHRSFASLRMTKSWKEVAGEEEGLAEVAGYDFFGMADGGQVDAGVPAE